MEILRQYNNDTLELISSDSYEFTSFGEIYVDSYFDLKGIWNDGVISDSSYWQSKGVTDKESFGNIHYELAGKFAGRGFPKIKLSVFSDIGSFQDFDDLQEGNDFYIRNNQIFLKPNEYLDRAGFSEGNYNLQFDFITRFKESNELYISEISPSRKEIRIEVDEKIYANGFDDDYLNQITSFLNGGDDDGTYQFNSCLELTQGRLIPINSYAVDNVTNNKRTFILKLNQPLPTDVVSLSKNFNISNKFLSSQTETIFFIDREKLAISGLGLTIDEGFLTENKAIDDNYKNYNQITSSVGLNIVEQISSQQKDLNLNIDYEKFGNHVFFGSAKSKLENFKTKAVKLEGLYNQISESLVYTSSLKVIQKRKDLFNEVRKLENEFTHYEDFMYNDGQSYSTSSAPGIGGNLAGNDFFSTSQRGFTHTREDTLQDYDGFNVVNKKGHDGFIHLTTDLYNVEQPPFYNSNDFFYLSFILRGGNSTSEYSLNISGGLSNEKYNTNSVSTLGNYAFNNDRQIPFDAWSGSALLNPQVTGSHYKRYIFKAQQNYFRLKSPSIPKGVILKGNESYAENSNDWEILSGSNIISASTSGSIGDDFAYSMFDITGKYEPYLFPTQYDTDGVSSYQFFTGSILPQGDLFSVFTQESGNKDAFFTDVVVTKNNPTNIHPFSKIYRPPSGSYAGSSEWNDWYDTMHTIASDYDDNNINSLVNNLPEFLRTDEEHKTLRDFVNMLGEQFDLLRSYIDNYHNFYRLGYKNPNAIPDNLLPIIGDSLGFNLTNPLSGSLQEYLESNRGDEVGDKKIIASLWTKILNNLIYVYKTRGTREGINALLNLYGYNPNSFNLTEYGGSTDEHNPSVVTNNATNDLDNGIKNITGNVSFKEALEPFNSLNLSSGSDYLSLDWWSNDAEPNGVEFIFRTTNTNNIQTLVRSSGSVEGEDHWDIRVVPSGSSNKTGSLQFRLNNSENAGSAIASNAISMSTDFINEINNNKYYNVLLQRSIVTGSYDVTQSYQMFVGRKDQDKIKDIQHISMSSFNTHVNQNFITSSGQSSNNLRFGETITGSVAEIRAWDAYISMSKFKQHILNYSSVVGDTVTTSVDNLVYHYPLNESPNASTIVDISSVNKVKSFNKVVSNQPSLQVKTSKSTVKNFSFQVRGTDAVKSDKQYKIGSNLKSIGGLSHNTSTLVQPLKSGTSEPNVQIVNKIGKTYSYVNAIDSIVINAMADFKLDDHLDDYDNNGIYDELLTLRKKIIQERGVKVDVAKNLSMIENHTDNPDFIEKIENVVPAKTKFEFSYEVKNDTLFRSKIKKAKLQTELNPNQAIGSSSLLEPNVSIIFNQNKHENSINVLSDEVSVSGFSNENLKTDTINILSDVGITSTANEKLITNESIRLATFDLSNSSNQTVFNVEPNNFTNLLLGSKNEFFKNHGKGENQTFFKSNKAGVNGDFNTYKYETRFFFKSIGDTEEYYPVSGSYKNRVGDNAKQPFNHHDNFRHFGNRYYVDSGSGYTYSSFFGSDDATVDGRMVGRTLFFSSSNGEIFYPINHYFKVGTSKDVLTNLIYKGTQNDGSNPTFFDSELDTSPKLPAYTIEVGGSDTLKKLKVIR